VHHQCGFQGSSRSTIAHTRVCCFHQILKKKEYNLAIHQLLIDFNKAYDSVTRQVFYNILIQFGIPTTLVKVIKMCLIET
jgi:hypothetical protein